MARLRPATFRLEEELMDALHEVKERDGVPVTEQIRRAVRLWLVEKDVKVKAPRKRARTRKRG